MESLHPRVVHFPVALLLAALLVETVALLLRNPAWHRVSLWNVVLGTLGAGAAVVTGRLAMAVGKHSYAIHQVMSLHERLGYVVLGVVVGVTLWRLAVRDRLSTRSRWLAWILLCFACGVMVFSAHLGGRLVYEFGVGGSYGRSGGIRVEEVEPVVR